MKSLKCTKCGSYSCAVDIGDLTYYANEGLEWLDPSDNVGQTLEEESLEDEILDVRCVDCGHHFVWLVGGGVYGNGFAEVKLPENVLTDEAIKDLIKKVSFLQGVVESSEIADAVVRNGFLRLVTTLQHASRRAKDKEERALHEKHGASDFVAK